MKKVIESKPKKQKKAKTRATVHKASLEKIANKKNNRLAKQGKLNAKVKKKKKLQAQRDEQSVQRQEQLNKQQEIRKLYAQNVQGSGSEGDENESDSEEEDNHEGEEEEEELENFDDFQHLPIAQKFASTNLDAKEPPAQKSKKRKREEMEEEEEEEADFELRPRAFQEDREQDMKMMLPIISKGKVIRRMVKAEDARPVSDGVASSGLSYVKTDGDDDDDGDKREDVTSSGDMVAGGGGEEEAAEMTDRQYLATLPAAQQFVYCRRRLAEEKQRIAALCQAVLGDPHSNMRKLKELRLLLGCRTPGIALSVRKFALVSMMEVFKDIVPGYRLRIPTEKERTQKVKKETKAIQDYEASFLLNYKVFLDFLETMAKRKKIENKTFLTKQGISQLDISRAAAQDLGKLSLSCLCEMLTSHTHFNYRDNIIVSLIPFLHHRNKEYCAIACEAVKKVFREDKQGDVTLEIVRAIGRAVKKLKFDLEPPILETFLALKIKEVDLSSAAKFKKLTRKEKMKNYSRRERKRLKKKEELDRELMETKATVDKQRKLKLHTEVIQAVFETYIRVIKTAPDSLLLPAVLEGLAKFAHLINVEYFDSLFSALNGLIETGNLTTKESLHCMQTAFTILTGQGSVLNIDPTRFYKHFYCQMLPIHAADTSETLPVALKCLEVMISKRKKQVSQQRVLAFIKRLTSLSLQQNPEGALAFLTAVRQYVHSHKCSDFLFDTEVQGSGVYLPYLEDPEHCCARGATLWELHLLRHHYNPTVRTYSHHLMDKAPLSGRNQLSVDLSRRSPNEIYDDFHSRDVFHSISEKCSKKKRRRLNNDDSFFDYISSISAEAAQVLTDDKKVMKLNTSDTTKTTRKENMDTS